MNRSSELVSNNLAIVTKLFEIVANFKILIHRMLLGVRPDGDERLPEWMGAAERRMLQLQGETKPTPNAVVAKDGSLNICGFKEFVNPEVQQQIPQFKSIYPKGPFGKGI